MLVIIIIIIIIMSGARLEASNLVERETRTCTACDSHKDCRESVIVSLLKLYLVWLVSALTSSHYWFPGN